MPWIPGLVALLACLTLIPVVRFASVYTGKVARPRPDRWHQKPTALFGGVGIFFAWLVALLVAELFTPEEPLIPWGILLGVGFVFVIGLYDDIFHIAPTTKFIGQILAATLAISSGVETNYFSPRLDNSPLMAQLLNLLLTYIWLIGITNAINLLDNMDGLAGGIVFITAGFLSYMFWSAGNTPLLVVTLALGGAVLGFMFYNFPPASIFMGDCGSLFLGFSLALLAIIRQPQASNVFAVLGVPTLLFLLPILDTTLVTVTRLMRGQSPARGGRDHTSHRLIAIGLSERKTVGILYLLAIVSGLAGVTIEAMDYRLSMVIVPLLVLALSLLTAYLGALKVVSDPGDQTTSVTWMRILLNLTYKRRLVEVILDFFLIGIVYYLAVLTVYPFSSSNQLLEIYLESVPFALAGAYFSFYLSGVYRGVWRYVGLNDLLRYGRTALGTGFIFGVIIWIIFSFPHYPLHLYIVFSAYLFLGLSTSRLSFKIFDLLSVHQTRSTDTHVLICGAGDPGEMAVRWIQMNPQFAYRPIGFIDMDPYKVGRQIHGIEVLGQPDQLAHILESYLIDGIILTEPYNWRNPLSGRIIEIARKHGCWVQVLRLEFDSIHE